MDPIMAMIAYFAFNFEQEGWLRCMGQVLNVQQNSALFSLMGNVFGGTYPNTFALPDLRGKVILGQGATGFDYGTSGGYATTSLNSSNVPSHTHVATLTLTNATTTVSANTSPGTTNSPSSRNGNAIGTLATGLGNMYNTVAPTVALNVAGNTVGGSVAVAPNTGGSTAFSNMPPYCVLNASIATQGLYPQRS